MINVVFSCVYLVAIIGFFIGIINGACNCGDNNSIIKFIKRIVTNLIGGTIIGGLSGAFGGFIFVIAKIII